MTKLYTQKDLENFYYKIFLKYNINSLKDLEKAIKEGIIPEDELLIKLDDLISPEERKRFELEEANQPTQKNTAVSSLSQTNPGRGGRT